MNEDELDAWREEAKRARGEDRDAVTVEILTRYVVRRPEDAFAWFALGDALRVVGRTKEARDALVRAERIAPDDRKYVVQTTLAQLEHDAGKYEEAEQWYGKATETSEGRETGWRWLLRGATLACIERFADAEACHRKATTLNDGDQDEAWLNLGYVLRAQRRYEEAALAFQEARRLDPHVAAYEEAILSLGRIQDVLQRLKAFD